MPTLKLLTFSGPGGPTTAQNAGIDAPEGPDRGQERLLLSAGGGAARV